MPLLRLFSAPMPGFYYFTQFSFTFARLSGAWLPSCGTVAHTCFARLLKSVHARRRPAHSDRAKPAIREPPSGISHAGMHRHLPCLWAAIALLQLPLALAQSQQLCYEGSSLVQLGTGQQSIRAATTDGGAQG